MHYYQFNIGDYRRQTHHLTLLEHGIYRNLLDTYYLTEKPLCSDIAKLMRSHSVRTANEKEALKNILSDFFELSDDGYHHSVCDKTIDKYREKSEKARKSAEARWGENANALQPDSEGNTNQEPITNNQQPVTKDKKPLSRFAPPTLKEVSDYCAERKNPVDPEKFIDFYESKGWMVGKNKMKSWKASVRTWEKQSSNNSKSSSRNMQMADEESISFREPDVR